MSAPRTVVVERVIGGMAKIRKPRRAIRSCWWRPARGGDQRRWGTQAPDHVAVYGGAEHGVRRRLQIGVCCREEDSGVRAEMGPADVATSGREAVAAVVAMKTMSAAATPATASQDLGEGLFGAAHGDVMV
jgi:hypothetical protein